MGQPRDECLAYPIGSAYGTIGASARAAENTIEATKKRFYLRAELKARYNAILEAFLCHHIVKGYADAYIQNS